MNYNMNSKCNCGGYCFDEYNGKAKTCIRKQQPDCNSVAVIPTITVESISDLTNLTNVFVHTLDTNTTYYFDDKGRTLITWAGPVNIPGYDMDNNPNGYKDQIITDTESGRAVIYDNHGVGYVFGVEFGDLQLAVDNKIDEMIQDGDFDRIISSYMTNATLSFNSISDMKTTDRLAEGSLVALTGESEANDGKGSFYIVRTKAQSESGDDYNVVELTNLPSLVAQRVPNLFEKYDMEFYSIEGASSGYVIKLPNKKVLLFDTGQSAQWSSVKNGLDSLGITKIDYLIISHFHGDHYGNVTNICNTYDTSDCVCYVGMKPDFTNHAAEIEETEAFYDGIIQQFRGLGLDPIVPSNDSYINVGDVKIHFLNTSLELAEEYDYYSQQAEWHDTGKCNLNLFSLVCEVMYGANVITLTGDIEEATEKAITGFMHKSTIMSSPHHGVNRAAYKPFYLATSPEYALLQFVTTKGSNTWIYSYFQSFAFLQQVGAKFVAPAWTNGIGGLYPFYISEYSYKTELFGTYIPSNRILHIGEKRSNINDFIDYLVYTSETVTLKALCERMEPDDSLLIYWYSSYNTSYPQLLSDLQSKIPFFGSNTRLEIERIGSSGMYKITADRNTYKAEYTTNFQAFEKVFGTGVIPSISEGGGATTELIEKISVLPVGQYICNIFYDGTNLGAGRNFTLAVNVTYNDGNEAVASIIATNRDTNPAATAVAFSGYIDTSSTPKFTWRQITTS